ncbi:urea ABC transporter permease subunit UrtC [Paenibacillus sp. GCM10023248]|uniref:urea ABC transporter permease subunit UrtC n=1 Tax=Bacillales TaxID=1385 RepID=UPI002378CF60|nr:MULTISPECIES: urea ABC transporter permease subunit UrtC [Bacillales]MDD9271273.1 urea ABC transporter permease subunit UrtC [Paenibacillus sp. MAHUQ-63]MDR6881605.1 urea transport system permease protein [Bacillus sp. 3255]
MLLAGHSKIKLTVYTVFLAALALAPLFLSEFRLSLLGKFLAYAIIAIGIDLIWGYTGILSLGHGVYFGLGGYCMAMHLKLAASGDQLPDFMSWSGVESLPWFWQPFHSAAAAFLLALLVPMLLAFVLGYLTFRNRIKGAFFSILSQALVIITVTLFVGQQGYTGGTNGLTNFDSFLGLNLQSPSTKLILFYVTLAAVAVVLVLCSFLVTSRLGNILTAIRDGENRVRFIGYNPVTYKVSIYCVSAGLAGLAGVLFVLQEGIISPAQMGIVPSIEMVLWVAIGGRSTIGGAVLGALVTNSAKTTFSEAYPAWWPIMLGAMFIIVVLLLPKGIVGTIAHYTSHWKKPVLPQPISSSQEAG